MSRAGDDARISSRISPQTSKPACRSMMENLNVAEVLIWWCYLLVDCNWAGEAEPAVTLVPCAISVVEGTAASLHNPEQEEKQNGDQQRGGEQGGKQPRTRPHVCSCACPDSADRQVCQVCCSSRRGHARAATFTLHKKLQNNAFAFSFAALFAWLAAAKNSHPCTRGELQPPLGHSASAHTGSSHRWHTIPPVSPV